MARFVQEGEAIDYTPGSAVAAGAIVVIGSVGIGVAQTAIAANVRGSLTVEGVIEHAKASGAVTFGAKVYYDATNNVLTTTATSNTLAGWAVAAAASGDATATIKLLKA
jgi:predicted RecA/RadA family phage recombinase